MARVRFTPALQRHIALPASDAPGETVRAVLDAVFAGHPAARAYVFDDQGALRKHMIIFINGRRIADRVHLADKVSGDDEIYVMQALSGG